MHKQLWFGLGKQENSEALWEGFPEQARAKVRLQVARLMAQRLMAWVQETKGRLEVGDEPSNA
jgi:hypothetical protein